MTHVRSYPLLIITLLFFINGCASKPTLEDELAVNKTPSEWIEIANNNSASGNLTDALYQYEQVLIQEPDNLIAIAGIAHIHTARHNYSSALKSWNHLLEKNVGNKEALIAKAHLLIRFGQLDDAEKTLQPLIEKNDTDWRVWDSLGVIHDLKNDYTNARIFYEKALSHAPDQAELYNNLGYSEMMNQAYDDAITHFTIGLRIAPNSAHLQSNLALAYAWKGEYNKAKSLFILQMDEAEAYNNIGYIAMLKKDYAKAELYFQTAIDKSPSFYRKAFSNLEKLREKEKQAIQ